MTLRGLVAAVAVVALAAGCAQSTVDPDVRVTVRGKLVLPNGEPAAGVEVGLMRVPDIGEVFFQGLVVAGTLFTACLASEPPPICKTVQRTKTNDQGEYAFRMRGSDVQGTFGQASTFHLGAVAPRRSGELAAPSIDTSFQIQREKLTMPTLRFWRPKQLSAQAGARRVRLDWSPRRDADGYSAHFMVEDGKAQVWRADIAPGQQIDARAVADMRGGFHVATTREEPGPDTEFQITHTSHQIGFQGKAGPPASRAAACSIRGETGQVPLEPCTLTDGAYQKTFRQRECKPEPSSGPSASTAPCRANSSAEVDLGTPRRIRAVFYHGLTLYDDVVIETSDDGERWTKHGALDNTEYGRLTLPGVTARHVRLRSGEDTNPIERLRELSVWAG